MTTLTLGGVTFADFEIPSELPFGGSQQKVVHKIIGGNRSINTMGYDPKDIEWSGQFRGSNAVTRVQQMITMCAAGLPVTLSWDVFTYQVIVSSFEPSYQRGYEIPYRLSCTVASIPKPPANFVSGLTAANQKAGFLGRIVSSVSDAVTGVFSDMSTVLTVASLGVAEVQNDLGLFTSVTGIRTPGISSLLGKLDGVQQGIGGAITVGDGHILTGLQQIGGVIPGNPGISTANLLGQINLMQGMSGLIAARGVVTQTEVAVQEPEVPVDSTDYSASNTAADRVTPGTASPYGVQPVF